MQPALDKHIPIRVKNSFNPEFEGTVISRHRETGKELIRGISSIDEVALLMIQGSGMIGMAGIAHRLFEALAREKINVIMISQASSEHSICLAIPPDCASRAESAVREEFRYEIQQRVISNVNIEPDMAIIAVVGENMRHKRGIAGRVFQALGENGVNISAIAQGSSELNISMVIDHEDEVQALNALHHSFFPTETRQLNIFLAGPGLIGGTLLKQIKQFNESHGTDRRLRLHLAGIMNSRRMVISKPGIDPLSWKEIIDRSGEKAGLKGFIDGIKQSGLAQPVLVDCTSSEQVAGMYPEILETGIAIVTANKKANTRETAFYQRLRPYANTKYFYETNVGAGLPVVGAIRDLVATGDKITRIEGVLSGTLSYLFNTFDGSQAFSELVRDAHDKGYTEPDPRDDLNGMDVARKILILLREAGFRSELTEIEVQNLVPEEARKTKAVEDFYRILQRFDDEFLQRVLDAQKEKKVLRYLARFLPGKATVGLVAADSKNPFYWLDGGENMVVIYSTYYSEQPLIIRGPGAGAQVTASGVLADILRLGRGPS